MNKTLEILLIEDDVIEVMKLRRTIKSLELNHKITVAENGEDAIKILNTVEKLPELILLDLNMPKINGIEFLSIIKKDDRFHHIPAVILSTSSNRSDIVECYRIGIAGYVIKPLKYEDYVEKIEKLLAYWSINELNILIR
ncbi:MAG: response regulator [Bacteroidia bacterium]|nr:response regulator [Bacteroidia bacterium]MBT8287450.1 response regulator [Bacteroidia bacterium]NNF81818.1 response regulator [Flavobacteriaceae bacterium]NNK72627.1 response regulator [Flavobacteriaceae bacterium]